MSDASATFTNQVIATKQLPQLENVAFQPLAAKYAPTHRLVQLVSALLIMLLLLVALYQPFIELPELLTTFLNIALMAVSVIGLASTCYVHFADPKKGFALREQDISYQSGLIFQTTVSQPILRIQHVELKRGPIDRKVGLANLQVFSAGGAMHTFEIPGLELQQAEHMRQFILAHKDINTHG